MPLFQAAITEASGAVILELDHFACEILDVHHRHVLAGPNAIWDAHVLLKAFEHAFAATLRGRP